MTRDAGVEGCVGVLVSHGLDARDFVAFSPPAMSAWYTSKPYAVEVVTRFPQRFALRSLHAYDLLLLPCKATIAWNRGGEMTERVS